MNARSFPALGISVLALLCFAADSAHAQATKIFVASFGSDANDGSRGSPKRNFQAAHDAVATGGEVVALDTAGYGALTITKSVGVTAPAGITGFVTATSNSAITINASGATVTLRGLTINSPPGGALRGIFVTDVSALEVNNCVISGFSNQCILFVPANAATLLAKDTTLRGNTGLIVAAGAAANAKVVLAGCRLESCVNAGLSIDQSSTPGVIFRVEARDCAFTGNDVGITLFGATNRVVLKDCAFSANRTAGIRVNTAGATVNVDGCTVAGSATGLTTVAGVNLLSRGNNTVEANTTDGTFTGTYTAK